VSWDANGHTTQFTSHISVVTSQCKLVSADGYGNADQRCPIGLVAWKGLYFFVTVIAHIVMNKEDVAMVRI